MTVLVRYSEIALKGKNRRHFEHKLLENMRRALADTTSFKCQRSGATFLLSMQDALRSDVLERLRRVFGIAYIAEAMEVEPKLDRLIEVVTHNLSVNGARSFAIVTRRSDKKFPYRSREVNEQLGEAIRQKYSLDVDLKSPDLSVYVEIMNDRFYCYWERQEGARGLPVGTAGKVGVLLSGGIDSPVAAYLIASRGCKPVYIHFHSAPYTNRASINKVREIVKLMEGYHFETRLYLVPFAKLQKEIVLKCPAELRVLLYRRFMMRIADRIARSERAHALVTGESIGQVASQTLPNLRSIEAASTLPVLRPLIGFAKEEIVTRAEAIGTYPISIQSDQDCCSYLMPRQPATASRAETLERAEEALETDLWVQQLLNETEKFVGEKSSQPFNK